MQQLAENLVFWIREKVSDAGAYGVVLGMSGGIDSSVVAALCKSAFPNNTLGLLLPCYSIQEDMDHAYMVANKLQIHTRQIDLDSVFDTLIDILPGNEFEPYTRKVAEANLKPRIRMITLYYFASQLRYLVVGSGNRCELEIGYFSKYGDGGVDILPLGNLVKSQVRELADYLDIPREITDKPPSAGLWAGQTDEQEIGLTYEQLDCYLTTGEASEEVKKRIDEKIALNLHKRSAPSIPAF
ncbi:NAD(+) synthase [Chloroflexota bacterium]